MAKNIIFVCVSNTCRSPIAENLLRSKLQKNGLSAEYNVVSRGLTEAYEPAESPASYQGIQVLKEDYNIDMSPHTSKMLTAKDVDDAYLIIPVKSSLISDITYNFPNSKSKIRSLNQDITDPWHQPVSVYRQTAQLVDHLLDDVVAYLTKDCISKK